MPDFGRLEVTDLGSTTPHSAPLYPALPWKLENVRMGKFTFDTDVEFVRRVLPSPLARPVPPYGALIVQEVADSTLGPFRLAAQLVGCRYLTFTRLFVLQAVVDGPVALAALREVWSYPAKPGLVTLEDTDAGGLRASVHTPEGALIATCTHHSPEPADTSKVLLEPELTIRVPPRFRVGDTAEPSLVQLSRSGSLRDARRGPFELTFSNPEPAYPWGDFPVLNHIVGVDMAAAFELTPTAYDLPYVSDEATLNRLVL